MELRQYFTVLWRWLWLIVVDNPLRTLLITSTDPTEGKTTTVANLGTVMDQAGLSVIVVDSDLRRPLLHQYFEVSRNVGLTNGAFIHS